MTKAALKKSIHKTIDGVNDESLLKAIYTILNNSIQSEFKEPFTIEEYKKRQKLSLKQVKEGKVKEHSTLKKKYLD